MHLTHVTGGNTMQTKQQIKPLPMYEVVELEVVEITITKPKGN